MVAVYKKRKGKIGERDTEEGRSQRILRLRLQEDLYDKGKGMLEDKRQDCTLHLLSS